MSTTSITIQLQTSDSAIDLSNGTSVDINAIPSGNQLQLFTQEISNPTIEVTVSPLIQGPSGTNGTNGVNGTNGTNGIDGKTVLNGTVNPTTQGNNGDFYINTVTNYIFGPKAAGVWPSGVSLVGPSGNNGTNGTNGSNGSSASGTFRNLIISTTGTNATVTVSCDEVVAKDASNIYTTLYNVSFSINSAASGVNGLDTGSIAASTWYAVYIIYGVSGTAGLISLSASSPTLPSGYTSFVRVGWVYTDATANKYPFPIIQRGRNAAYSIQAGSNLTAWRTMVSVSATTAQSGISWSTFMPSTASAVIARVVLTPTSGASSLSLYANSGSGSLLFKLSNTTDSSSVELVKIIPESSNIYYSTSLGTSAVFVVNAYGWEDNI